MTLYRMERAGDGYIFIATDIVVGDAMLGNDVRRAIGYFQGGKDRKRAAYNLLYKIALEYRIGPKANFLHELADAIKEAS